MRDTTASSVKVVTVLASVMVMEILFLIGKTIVKELVRYSFERLGKDEYKRTQRDS